VIVESRRSQHLAETIRAHMQMLPGWDMRHLADLTFPDPRDDYNRLLTSTSFWARFESSGRVLIFQHDSMLLRHGVDEFLDWAYAGAPWPADAPWGRPERKGGNGGLSLRNPRKMLELCSSVPWQPSRENEDSFFVGNRESVGGRLAPLDVCQRFSCETMFALGTLGYHAIDRYLSPDEVHMIKSQYSQPDPAQA
jgi:hypothetical protein